MDQAYKVSPPTGKPFESIHRHDVKKMRVSFDKLRACIAKGMALCKLRYLEQDGGLAVFGCAPVW